MKNKLTPYPFIFILLLIFQNSATWAEGTKEFMPDEDQPTKILIARGNSGGQPRDPFAIYDGLVTYRLYIHIQDPGNEKIYFGLGARTGDQVNTNGWRIHRPDGTVIFQSSIPTSGQQGYINDYQEAVNGPNVINPAGYNPKDVTPIEAGDYYMTFQVNNNTSRTFDYFDITVVNITTNTAILGRVFSKCWQFSNPQDPTFTYFYTFWGQMYIYSNDQIVTKLNPNGFEGRDFSFSSNDRGCYDANSQPDPNIARKSVEGRHNYPLFPVFLNIPNEDSYTFGIIGELLPSGNPQVTVVPHCQTGTMDFIFNVTAAGSVEITLLLSEITGGGYIDRKLIQSVVAGENTITWDGFDGSTPTPTAVPNGKQFHFSLKYVQGMTHLPLYDVERNENGFIVTLSRPDVPLEPLFYWDDTGLNPNICSLPSPNQNLTGCQSSAAACHHWTGTGGFGGCDQGDQRTINTWWYIANTTVAPIDPLTEQRIPATPSLISGPDQVCLNSSNQYSIPADPNSEQYHWTWPSGELTTPNSTITISFTASPIGPGYITVHGINTSTCSEGGTQTKTIEVLPLPDLTTSLIQGTCSGVPFNIPLTSNPPGANYSWTVQSTDCSSNISVCPTGSGGGTSLSGNLSVNDLNQGAVIYHITPSASGCSGTTKNLMMTVDPLPNLTSPSNPTSALCSGGMTSIVLASGLPDVTFTWSVQTGGCTNIQVCPSPGVGSPISNQLTLADNSQPGFVVYTIIPSRGGCNGNPVNHTVNVNQIPVVTLDPFSPVCLNTPPFTLTGGNPSGGHYTYNGNTIVVFDPASAGVGNHAITYTYSDANSCTSSDTKSITVQSLITPVITGDGSACKGVSEPFQTDPGMQDYLWSVTPDGNITAGATPDITNITWPTTGIKTINVTYTDPNGCVTIPGSKSVLVNGLPVPTITGNNNVCVGSAWSYTTETGMTGYSWNVSAGNNIAPNGNSATVTWNTTGSAEWVEVNYIDQNGCTAVTPFRKTVNVNPSPILTITGNNSLCAGSTNVSYSTTAGYPVYSWSVTSGGTITGPANTNAVTVSWASNATPNQTITVNYTNALGCSNSTPLAVTINPLPVATFTGNNLVCQLYPDLYLYTADAGPTCNYTWSVIPNTYGTVTNPSSNPGSVTWNTPGNATLRLDALTGSGCTSFSTKLVQINPRADVSIIPCFDPITSRSAKPFILKGGKPLLTGSPQQGEYLSNPATTALYYNNGNYYFDPSIVPGNIQVTYSISYKYTNQYNCPATTTTTIPLTVRGPNPACGSSLTDYRDGTSYRTSLIAGKCWMMENLRYGSTLTPATKAQTDNCTTERYCLSSDANCTTYGGLYQWDELIQYGQTDGPDYQGVCPPGWHIPSSLDWQNLINNAGGNGLAAGPLTDLNLIPEGFETLLKGVYYMNSTWAFTVNDLPTATMFWTSTPGSGSRIITRSMNNQNPSVSLYESSKANAFPVRCIKD